MTTRFWKYHGLGNDFVLVDHRGKPDIDAAVTRAVCDRHKGIGADGILALLDAPPNGHYMRVFNADGSVADMCGNGLRCFVRWLVEVVGVPPEPMTIGSDAGAQRCIPRLEHGQVVSVTVNLGPASVRGSADVQIGGSTFSGHDLFLGNPHFVIPSAPGSDDPAEFGPDLSIHDTFPQGSNVEWLQVLSAQEASVVVYERGVGLTKACGTGGAAAAAIGARVGLLKKDEPILVHQAGGDLTYVVESDGGDVWMTGPAVLVFEGETELF